MERNRASQAQLKADFEAFLDGFSPNVQEILDNFESRNQLRQDHVAIFAAHIEITLTH